MPSFRDALNALAALEVRGTRANYGLAELPETLMPAQLPALLTLPGEIQERSARRPLFGERAGGFEALAFAGAAATITLIPWHLLLVAPLVAGLGRRSHLPRLVELLEAYFQALSADVTLGGCLLEPTQMQVEIGVFPYGGAEFHGCLLRHRWKLAL